MNQFKHNKKQLIISKIHLQNLFLNNYRLACLFLMLASFTVLLLNHFVFHYQGFNYVSHDGLTFLNSAIFLKMASFIFEPLKKIEKFANDCIRLFACYVILMIATTAIQYTPFELIDDFLFQHEPLPIPDIIDWTRSHGLLYEQLTWLYSSLDEALVIVPFLFILLRQSNKINDLCHFLVWTCIIGFGFYFFFPSCGPVHLFDKVHFIQAQANNYQKYFEIHHGLFPVSDDGGMIACPSFHVIWAWSCTRFFISYRRLFPFALTWFIGIVVSTILLGWHYSIDVIFALLIISSYEVYSRWALKRASYWLTNWQNKLFT